jgi:hypothetical protein
VLCCCFPFLFWSHSYHSLSATICNFSPKCPLTLCIYIFSVSPKGIKFLSTAEKIDGTPLVLQLTAEMIDLEEHGSSQHKEDGGLNLVPTLESEKFSEVGSSNAILLITTHPLLTLEIVAIFMCVFVSFKFLSG